MNLNRIFLIGNSVYLAGTGILGMLGIHNIPEPGLRMILGSSLGFIVLELWDRGRKP